MMGFLDWMKGKIPAPEPGNESRPPDGYTRKGNPIEQIRAGEWQSEMGIRETRVHIGKSVEGFHGGFQNVPSGGGGPIQWSNARPTEGRAWSAAYGMADRRQAENSDRFVNHEDNLIQEFEAKKQRHGKDKPSRTHSVFADYPDRVLKTQTDVEKDDALLEMTLVVNEIANDPDTNWQRHKADFEKAVTGMREAFAPELSLNKKAARHGRIRER